VSESPPWALTRRHMDSDESVAFGAGLHAANMSTAFRVRKFGAVDAASYAMAVEFDSAAAATEVRVHHCAGRACEGTALGEPARALRWESLRGSVACRDFRWGVSSRGRFATPADFPLHDCSPYRELHVRRES
jgi:hypothetical protein